MEGSGAAGLRGKPRGPLRPCRPGAARPGGVRVSLWGYRGEAAETPPLRAALPPARHAARGAEPAGRGGACMQILPAGRGCGACALCARSSTGSYTMHRARGPRGRGGASHVNEGRVLPRYWRRERKGWDRICKAASRRSAWWGGGGSERSRRRGVAHMQIMPAPGGVARMQISARPLPTPCPSVRSAAALKGAAPAQSVETGT